MEVEYSEEICITCNWYLYHKTSECRECVHPGSIHYGDWTGPRNSCPEWVGRRKPATINRDFDAAIDAMSLQLRVANEKCKEINEQVRQTAGKRLDDINDRCKEMKEQVRKATAKYWESEVTDMEDKAAITRALLPVLQMTRNQADLVALEYSRDGDMEIVTATWDNGATKSCGVTCDSGTALIRDVMRMLD